MRPVHRLNLFQFDYQNTYGDLSRTGKLKSTYYLLTLDRLISMF